MTRANSKTRPAKPGGGSGLFPTLKNLAPSKEFRRMTATFRDPNLETAYRQHLIDHVLYNERLLAYWWTLIYFLFGFLDFLVIGDRLAEVITVRWALCTPFGLMLVLLTHLRPFHRWYAHLYTLGVFTYAISIVWMISVLPAQDPPPYIIGVLTVFIFAACVYHMPFWAAASTFSLVTLTYFAVLLTHDKFSQVQIISGFFFMGSSTLLAIGTNYVQEIRSRILWRQQMLREKDAVKIKNLLVEATAADQTKINFLSMMSHELRTPLHQIIGYAEVVRNSFVAADNDNENTPHIEQIHTSANLLLERIKKMLTYSEVSAGRLSYNIEGNNAREMVDAVIDKLHAQLDAKKISVDRTGLRPAMLRIDFFHTSYALGNILENAINASQNGGVIRIVGDMTEDNAYALSVVDEGAGMSEETLAKVFSAFSQGENHMTRASEGLGLGLTLANRIIADQNGWIDIDSEPGRGTTVTITFRNLQSARKSPRREEIASVNS